MSRSFSLPSVNTRVAVPDWVRAWYLGVTNNREADPEAPPVDIHAGTKAKAKSEEGDSSSPDPGIPAA